MSPDLVRGCRGWSAGRGRAYYGMAELKMNDIGEHFAGVEFPESIQIGSLSNFDAVVGHTSNYSATFLDRMACHEVDISYSPISDALRALR